MSDNKVEEDIRMLAEIEKTEHCDPMLMLMRHTKLKSAWVDRFNDCNPQHEPGYYEEQLNEISRLSKGAIVFSDVREEWNDEGQVDVYATHAGETTHMHLDVRESWDLVPEAFLEYINGTVMAHRGDQVFFCVGSGEGDRYYFLPRELAQELTAIREAYVPSL